jgi:hypothetical protein
MAAAATAAAAAAAAAGALQDIVTRYACATGHHCTRRFGWDCHGLPVEYEIDKKLGACWGVGGSRGRWCRCWVILWWRCCGWVHLVGRLAVQYEINKQLGGCWVGAGWVLDFYRSLQKLGGGCYCRGRRGCG